MLSRVYRIVSGSEQLMTRLQFKLEKKLSPSPTTVSKNQCGRRLASLFRYDPVDPADHPTRALLQDYFEQWTEQPSSFWAQLPQDLGYHSTDPQRIVVVAALQLEQSSAHSVILRRFYSIVLHRLRANRPGNEDSEIIARSVYEFLHPGTSQPGVKDLYDLTTSVESLVQAGSRYVNIARKLGIGSLFLLGKVVGKSVSVSTLSLKAQS
jgi:hypothetical protein